MTVSLRLAVPTDLSSISAIEALSFSNPWHPDTFRSLLTRERVRVLAAESGGEVVGYAVFWWVMDQGELANLAVHPESQGKGVGSRLLDQVLTDAKAVGIESLFLEVRESNERARRLYAQRGFVQISVREGYYRNPPEDACILVKDLSPTLESEVGSRASDPQVDSSEPTVRIQ
ncbi:MAG: ribosomal protein S18-alanine N-acetyltransferase [Gemmatimonadota bacterium]|jgi:ribosomal-protein-alanine N-acetyltransferase